MGKQDGVGEYVRQYIEKLEDFRNRHLTGETVRDSMIREIRKNEDGVVVQIIKEMGNLADPGFIDVIGKFVSYRWEEDDGQGYREHGAKVRKESVIALGKTGDNKVIPMLMDLLNSRPDMEREYCDVRWFYCGGEDIPEIAKEILRSLKVE